MNQERKVHQPWSSGTTAREWLNTLLTIAVIITLYFVMPFGRRGNPLPLGLATALSILIAILLTALISRRILRIIDGTISVGIPGLLILLTAVIVAFSTGYYLLARSDPAEIAGLHTRLDSLYFTLTTVATIGYGDIHPAGQAARAIACFQVVFNSIFLAGLVRATLYEARAVRTARGRESSA
jgi:voltage-gated potassium channel